jgi:carbonic anhydrase
MALACSVVRLAGNKVTRTGLESIDYAVRHLGTRLITVLGHESYSAVKGGVRRVREQTRDGIAGDLR